MPTPDPNSADGAGFPHSSRALAFMRAWSARIGPEYARLFLPIRKRMLVGLVFAWLSPVVALVAVGPLLQLQSPVGEWATIAIILPFLAPFYVSIFQLMKLVLRIKRDLEAAGFRVKPSGPDLRNTSWFDNWSKRSGITPEVIIATGHKVLGISE